MAKVKGDFPQQFSWVQTSGVLLIPKTCASTWPGSVSATKSVSSAQHDSIWTCIYMVPGNVHTWGSLRVLCFSMSPVLEIICGSTVSSWFCDLNNLLGLSYFRGGGQPGYSIPSHHLMAIPLDNQGLAQAVFHSVLIQQIWGKSVIW